MTLHGRQEMAEDRLSVADVCEVLMAGRITERQRDARTQEWKYLVEGTLFDERKVTVVTKLGSSGQLVVIIVYPS